jgi:nitroreductase/Pyruvate/2-oxoacid:ferredoxin oxidoreductase delta subunit
MKSETHAARRTVNDITFGTGTCAACGLCARVCPNLVIMKNDAGAMAVNAGRAHVCFMCGQCMAVCPTRSVRVRGLSYERNFFDLPASGPDASGFFDLLRTRRAVRAFRDKPVPRDLLEKIVQAISLAPPGFPPLKTGIVVVEDPAVMRRALPLMIGLYEGLMRAMGNLVARFFIRREVGLQKFLLMRKHLLPLLRTRMAGLRAGTEDTITRGAPAMILFHADRAAEDAREDLFVAAAYGSLAAHALGLGGSIMSIIPPAVDRTPALRELLKIPEGHEVVTSLIVGYPAVKYRRGIKRELKSVTWI